MVRPKNQILNVELFIGGKKKKEKKEKNLVESKNSPSKQIPISQPEDLSRIEPCGLNRLALRGGSAWFKTMFCPSTNPYGK